MKISGSPDLDPRKQSNLLIGFLLNLKNFRWSSLDPNNLQCKQLNSKCSMYSIQAKTLLKWWSLVRTWLRLICFVKGWSRARLWWLLALLQWWSGTQTWWSAGVDMVHCWSFVAAPVPRSRRPDWRVPVPAPVPQSPRHTVLCRSPPHRDPNGWIAHQMHIGTTLAFLLPRSDFKLETGFGFPSLNYTGQST